MFYLDLMLAQAGGNQWTSMLFMGGILVVFYLFFIRPQTQKAKEQKAFIEAIKKGDRVVTTGGIHGKVSQVSETTITLEVDQNIRLKFDRSAINLDSTKALAEDKK